MSEPFEGLVLVERLDLSIVDERRWRTALTLNREEIETRYVGLECEPWPDETAPPTLGEFPRVAPTIFLPSLRRVYEEDKRRGGALRLLYVASAGNRRRQVPDGFAFSGYDYGFLESKYSNYSVVLNEILFGLYDDLTAFAIHLNRNLLIDSLDLVSSLARARGRLLKERADVETSEECDAVEIYELKSI